MDSEPGTPTPSGGTPLPASAGTPASQVVAGTPNQDFVAGTPSQGGFGGFGAGSMMSPHESSGWGTPMGGGTPLSQRSYQAAPPRGELGRLATRNSAQAQGPETPTQHGSERGAPSTPSRTGGGGGGGGYVAYSPAGSFMAPDASPAPSSRMGDGGGGGGSFLASPGAVAPGVGSPGGGSVALSPGGGVGGGVGGDPASSMPQAVIWGTNVNVQESMDRFRDFVVNFGADRPESVGVGVYHNKLEQIQVTRELNLGIDCRDLASHPGCRRLYEQLVKYPQELVPIMDLVLHELYLQLAFDADGDDGYGDGDDEEGDEAEGLQGARRGGRGGRGGRGVGGAEAAEQALAGKRIQARPFNLQDVHQLRELDPTHIDTLVALTGMVTRVSPVIPDLKQGFFQCALCQHTCEVMIDRGRIDEPTACGHCKQRLCMSMVHNRCLFMDKQLVRVQELAEEIPEGETPTAVALFAFEDLVDTVRPGDRVEVTGIFRAVPRRVSAKQRSLRSVYKTHLDVIHYRKADRQPVDEEQEGDEEGGGGGSGGVRRRPGYGMDRGGADGGADGDEEDGAEEAAAQGCWGGVSFAGLARLPVKGALGKFSARRLRQMAAVANDPSCYERLTAALAPGIWELDDVKKGVLCQLFGGAMGAYDDSAPGQQEQGPRARRGPGHGGGGGHGGNAGGHETRAAQSHKARGEINVLLCGDPGTSKSQILSYVHKLAPRGVYTSGKGSSAVGLTASVVRDPDSKDMVLESGALVLSDLGVCCIDEFDKMSDQTRAILHEAMEQQTISIAKAGIICTLNARTSILASANPEESRYNPNKSVVANLNLPPTLLSRFDLIYLILDRPDADADRRLAKHLVSLYFQEPTLPDGHGGVDHALLRDYVAYARAFVHPSISDAAERELIEAYLEMRRLGVSSKTITATPRQLESLIRLSEARARLEWRTVVERRDVAEAVRLMAVATQAAATDPRTGTLDMDMLCSGTTAGERRAGSALGSAIEAHLGSLAPGTRLHLVDLRTALEQGGGAFELSLSELRGAVTQLGEGGASGGGGAPVLTWHEASSTVIVRQGNGGGGGR